MTSAPLQPVPKPARRTVMTAAGAAGLAVALTACGSDDSPGSSGSSGSSGNGGGSGGGENAGAGSELAKISDIPEGGGKVFESQGVVVTQPTAGEFRAFSATCTHQGCAVKSVADGLINCPCHQSNFSIADGKAKSGPAVAPLPAKEITVDGDSIKLA